MSNRSLTKLSQGLKVTRRVAAPCSGAHGQDSTQGFGSFFGLAAKGAFTL